MWRDWTESVSQLEAANQDITIPVQTIPAVSEEVSAHAERDACGGAKKKTAASFNDRRTPTGADRADTDAKMAVTHETTSV